MKLASLAVLFPSLVFALYAQTPSVDLHGALDAQMQTNQQDHGIPAQALVVLHNGSIVYRNATGTTAIGGASPVTPKTVFPIFSISKLFANVIALQLVEEGKIDLAAPASRYVTNRPASWRDTRVDEFLSHVSGVPEYYDSDDLSRPFPPSLDAVFAQLATVPLLYPPGTQTRYTGTNYLVIEAILQAVTHKPYRTLVTERIISPLGLHDIFLDIADVPKNRLAQSYHAERGRVVLDQPIAWPVSSVAHGNTYSTLDDIGTFLSAVAQGRLVSKVGLLRFWRPYPFANGNNGYFASGWEYGESGRWHEVGHDGGAKIRVRILFGQNLDEYYGIAYLTNGNNDDIWSRKLIDPIEQMILPK